MLWVRENDIVDNICTITLDNGGDHNLDLISRKIEGFTHLHMVTDSIFHGLEDQ